MSIAYQCWEMGVGSTVGVGVKSHSLPQYHHVVSENHNHSSLRCHSSPSHETSFVMFMQQTSSDLKQQHQQQKPVSSTVPPVSATSTVTTEEEAATTATMGEAESRPLMSSKPLVRFHGRGSMSKPGVVEHITEQSKYHQVAYESNSSESSSSICQASEDSGSCSSGDNTGGEEAQSAYRGPLTTMMSALDESLPIKRPGLSKFFGGKSRSFSSLAEVSTVTELAKPNNPYAKRRKMGFNCPLGDKTRSYPPPTRSSGASIAKKLPSSGSRNTLAVAVILGGLQESEQVSSEGAGAKPPVQPEIRGFPSRSYSLTDLPHHAGSPPRPRPLARP